MVRYLAQRDYRIGGTNYTAGQEVDLSGLSAPSIQRAIAQGFVDVIDDAATIPKARYVVPVFIPGTLTNGYSTSVPLYISGNSYNLLGATAVCGDVPTTVDASNYMRIDIDDGTTTQSTRIDANAASHVDEGPQLAKVIYEEGADSSSSSGPDLVGNNIEMTSTKEIGSIGWWVGHGGQNSTDVTFGITNDAQDTVLGQASLTGVLTSSKQWIEMTLPSPVTMTSGTRYWVKMRRDNGNGLSFARPSGNGLVGATWLGGEYTGVTTSLTYVLSNTHFTNAAVKFRLYEATTPNMTTDLTVSVNAVGTPGAGPGGDVTVYLHLQEV